MTDEVRDIGDALVILLAGMDALLAVVRQAEDDALVAGVEASFYHVLLFQAAYDKATKSSKV